MVLATHEIGRPVWPSWFVGFDVAAVSVPVAGLTREVVGRMIGDPGIRGWLAPWHSIPLFTLAVLAGGAAITTHGRRGLAAYLTAALMPVRWWLAVLLTISR